MGKVVIILVVIGLFLSLAFVTFGAEPQVKVFLPIVPIQEWHVIQEYPCDGCPPILKPTPMPTYTPEAPW